MGVVISPSREPKRPTVAGIIMLTIILAAAGTGLIMAVHPAKAQTPAETREQKLQESIDRLTGQREQVRQELIAAKQELRTIQQELATTTNEITITIKLSIPPCAHKPQVKVEQE